eukprot:s1965_g4.t1
MQALHSTGQIEPSPFVDEDAEAVKAKYLEEVREEEETHEMSLHDKLQLPANEEAHDEPYSPSIAEHGEEPAGRIFDDWVESPAAPSSFQQPPLLAATSSQQVDLTDVPQTPQVAPVTPRSYPESWLDRLADQVELTRFCGMGVLEEATVESLGQEEQLTTKFVYDWR